MKVLNLLIILFSTYAFVNAQTYERLTIDCSANGNQLAIPFMGGLNNPQFSEADFNGDGINDLYIYDAEGNVHLSFINEGISNEISYNFAPEYTVNFPYMNSWVFLRDYNGDGIQDIFTHSDITGLNGIIVYTGYNDNGMINFERFTYENAIFDLLQFTNSSGEQENIFALNVDYPIFEDIDGDNDIDILAFTQGGGFVEYFKNQSVELGYGLDSLIYLRDDLCWGGFAESFQDGSIILADESGECANGFTSGSIERGIHGSASLLAFDIDNDNDKDIVYGDLLNTTVKLLINGGTTEEAYITAVEEDYPAYDIPVDMNFMPICSYLDVNNDDKKDLIVSPFFDVSENVQVTQFYENLNSTEQPLFEKNQIPFLTNDIIDLGTRSHPEIVDVNADGLLDIVVGTLGYFEQEGNQKDPRLVLFLNNGTSENPAFNLVNDDWLNFSQYGDSTWAFAPTFGDLDSDGDLDMLVGDVKGRLYYGENTAAENAPMQFDEIEAGYMDIDVAVSIGQDASPQLIDMNRDGLIDLVFGERDGRINYFQNIGTATQAFFDPDPSAMSNDDFFGKIDENFTGFSRGFTSPFFIDVNGSYQLVLGTELAGLKVFDNIDENLDGIFDYIPSPLNNLRIGSHLNPALADLNNNGYYDLIIGNARGGLDALTTAIPINNSTQTNTTKDPKFSIYPNPSENIITIDFGQTESFSIQVFNTKGQLLHTSTGKKNRTAINLNSFNSGLYFIEAKLQEAFFTKKIIKK